MHDRHDIKTNAEILTEDHYKMYTRRFQSSYLHMWVLSVHSRNIFYYLVVRQVPSKLLDSYLLVSSERPLWNVLKSSTSEKGGWQDSTTSAGSRGQSSTQCSKFPGISMTQSTADSFIFIAWILARRWAELAPSPLRLFFRNSKTS